MAVFVLCAGGEVGLCTLNGKVTLETGRILNGEKQLVRECGADIRLGLL